METPCPLRLLVAEVLYQSLVLSNHESLYHEHRVAEAALWDAENYSGEAAPVAEEIPYLLEGVVHVVPEIPSLLHCEVEAILSEADNPLVGVAGIPYLEEVAVLFLEENLLEYSLLVVAIPLEEQVALFPSEESLVSNPFLSVCCQRLLMMEI